MPAHLDAVRGVPGNVSFVRMPVLGVVRVAAKAVGITVLEDVVHSVAAVLEHVVTHVGESA